VSEPWHTKAGGRKFLVVASGMVFTAIGPVQGATVDYYLTLGGMVGAFITGNWAVERVHAGKPSGPARRDSSADSETM
jgi:hypothetical protein